MPHISISQLCVDFPIYGAHSRSLKKQLVAHATGGTMMAGSNDVVIVRGLDNISLEIADGQRIGLTGHNGSGKTTLLRVLAGLYKPTQGSVTLTGRVGALLDPSAGMDADATGVENIRLRARLLGMSTEQINEQLDDIIAFTDLAEFINLPMRTYSAGMVARLAFSISTAIRPDILLMDEGIGAGDAQFMTKVSARIQEMVERSPILVLASHDQALIEKLCNRVLTFEHGRIVDDRPGG